MNTRTLAMILPFLGLLWFVLGSRRAAGTRWSKMLDRSAGGLMVGYGVWVLGGFVVQSTPLNRIIWILALIIGVEVIPPRWWAQMGGDMVARVVVILAACVGLSELVFGWPP